MSRFDVWRPGTHEPLAPPILHSDKCARAEDTLTWQQQEGLSKNKSRRRSGRAAKFVPLNLEALATEPQVPVESHTEPLEHLQAHDTAPKVSDKPRLEAPRREKHHTARSAQALQSHDAGAKKPCSNRKKRKPKNVHKPKDMAAKSPPTGMYIPPHLRKSTAAAEPTNGVRLGDLIALDSLQTSDKSQLQKLAAEVSSIQVISQEQIPITPPRTAKGSSSNAIPEVSPTHAIPPKKNQKWVKDEGWNAMLDSIPKPLPEPFTKHKGKPFWSRVPKAPRQKHVWIKSRDIPKKASTHSSDDGGIDFESDSGGDPAYDIKKLMDWNGDWLPPPEEWAARKGFNPRHFSQGIEQWINGHSRNCVRPIDINSPDFTGVIMGEDKQGRDTFLTKDVVPRYWLYDMIDNAAPRKFWDELPQRAPAPLSDIDIFEHRPYWERWEDEVGKLESCYMLPLAVPEARVNISDPENEQHPYAMISTADRVQKIAAVKEARRRKIEARRNRPISNAAYEVVESPNRCLSLRANVYFRPVQSSDIRGITTIFNHYVKNTVSAEEVQEQTEAQIQDWVGDIVKAGLPCLVAVAKRNQRNKPGAYVNEAVVGETIVGWIHLEPYSAGPMHRFSFELALYVHPGYIRQGIGKCLLDQLMDVVDTGYNKRGGYEYINNTEYLKTGRIQTVKTIIVKMHYEQGEDVQWSTDYFGDYGFKRAGRFYEIGHKDGKVANVVMFQCHTAENINPRGVPMLP